MRYLQCAIALCNTGLKHFSLKDWHLFSNAAEQHRIFLGFFKTVVHSAHL